jgi:histidine triad (HIT) family protein
MEDDLYLGLMQFSKKIAVALEKQCRVKMECQLLIGSSHAHVHLIPLNDMDEMRFQNKVVLTQDEFETLWYCSNI